MSAFTRNLPWPIKDLGISIIGEVSPSRILTISPLTSEIIKQECYTSLIESLNFSDVKCLKYSFSKALGIGIVFGGSVMKVPQISLSKCPLKDGLIRKFRLMSIRSCHRPFGARTFTLSLYP